MVSERSLVLRGRLARLAVRCPGCSQAWLAPGLGGGDSYACKACGAVLARGAAGAPARPPRDLPGPLPRQGAG